MVGDDLEVFWPLFESPFVSAIGAFLWDWDVLAFVEFKFGLGDAVIFAAEGAGEGFVEDFWADFLYCVGDFKFLREVFFGIFFFPSSAFF